MGGCFCGRETFEKTDKCIFHCKKDDWFDYRNDVNFFNDLKFKLSVKKKKELFWKELRDDLKRQSHLVRFNFRKFIFPNFDYIDLNIVFDNGNRIPHSKTNKGDWIYGLSTGLFPGSSGISRNFWNPGQLLVFDKIIDFSEAIFLGDADFSFIYFNNEVIFDNVVFKKQANFWYSIFGSKVSFQNVSFYGKVVFNLTKFYNQVIFSNKAISSGVVKPEMVFHDDAYFLETEFHMKIILSGVVFFNRLSFRGSKIKFLVIEHLITKNQFLMSFEESDVEWLYLQKIPFKIQINLSNLNHVSYLKIDEVNLSCSEFHPLDLSCAKVKIKNTSFLDGSNNIILNDVKWPPPEKFTANRDTYRQLKCVNELQGNIIEANKFYSLEMSAFKKEMKEKLKKGEHVPIEDRLVFWLNEKISDFSRSWLRPLGIVAALAMVFSTLESIERLFNQSEPGYFYLFFTSVFILISLFLFDSLMKKKVSGYMKSKVGGAGVLTIIIMAVYYYIFKVVSYHSSGEAHWFCRFIEYPFNEFVGMFNITGEMTTAKIIFRTLIIVPVYQLITALRRQTRRR